MSNKYFQILEISRSQYTRVFILHHIQFAAVNAQCPLLDIFKLIGKVIVNAECPINIFKIESLYAVDTRCTIDIYSLSSLIKVLVKHLHTFWFSTWF